MKLTFNFSNKNNFGDLQKQISETICEKLKEGKDFIVKIEEDKTALQLRGFYRICDILSPYMSEAEGVFFDKDMVKEYVKQETNYCITVKGKVITKSLKSANRQEMRALIERLYELGEFFEAKDFKLTSYEKQALVEYFNKKE